MKKRNKYELIDFMHKGKPLLSVINPDIEQLSVSLDFTNDENIHRSVRRELKPQDTSIFVTDCINPSCTEGLFDLTNEIYFLLRDNKASERGEKRCEGWQDEERKHNHKCMTKLNYHIIAKYK